MPVTVLRRRGQITIPTSIRAAADLQEGDELEIELTGDGILIRRVAAAPDDRSAARRRVSRARVRAAIDAIRSGRRWVFEDGEEFLAVLKDYPSTDADV